MAISASSASAQEQPQPEIVEISAIWVDDATFAVLEEIALLAELRALAPEPSLGYIVEFMAFGSVSREFALGELEFVDDLNTDLLGELPPTAISALSDEVLLSLRALPTSSFESIEAGELAFIDPGPLLGALTDLILRNGGAPEVRRAADSRVIVETLAVFAISDPMTFAGAAETIDADNPIGQRAPLRPHGPPADQGTAPPVVGNGVRSPFAVASDAVTPIIATESRASSASRWWIAFAVVAAVTASLITILFGRSRRGTDAQSTIPRIARVLDAGRRMTGAVNEDEVMAIAVSESVALAEAEAGAFACPHPTGATVTSYTDSMYFATGLVRGGALSRVLETGQSIMMVAHTESFLALPPMAVAIVPAIASGGVAGAVIVVRDADRPFSAADMRSVELLAPTTATALLAAAEHDSMATAAEIDAMTGLKNRRRLDHDLDELEDNSTLCFAMIDVDHFKGFNDSHGHLAGDIALQSVARAIEAGVRETDTVYRFGGEEFSVLLRGCGVEEAMRVLERVRMNVESTPVPGIDGTAHFLTVSVGVVANDKSFPTALPQLADEALYAAKHAGRNRVVATTST